MVATHFIFTHGNEPRAKKIISELKVKETGWIKASKTSAKEVEEAYHLLEFCDAFSIIFYQNNIQPEKGSLEISDGPYGKMYEVIDDNEYLVVKPWAFEVDEFEVTYEIRKLSKIKFETDDEFRSLLYNTTPEQRVLKLKK